MPVLIIVGVIVILIIWIVSLYNGLVRLRNRRQNAFADIDVQLRQRHDLVPQLVETVKGYASHEKDLLLKVTEARTAAVAATTIDGKIAAEQQLSSELQEELSDIENKLAASRRFFNGATTEYNNGVESFPGNLIARNFGFLKEVMFDLGTDTRKNMEEPPVVKF